MEASAVPARPALLGLALLVVSLAATFLVGPASQLASLSHGQPQPGLSFLATPAAVDGYLVALGDAGRAVFLRAEWFDFANAILIAVAGVLVIRWLASNLPSDVRWPRAVAVLPLLAGMIDVAENVMTIRAVRSFPALSPTSLPWVTSLKLLLILLSLLAIAGLAAIALRLRRLAPVPV